MTKEIIDTNEYEGQKGVVFFGQNDKIIPRRINDTFVIVSEKQPVGDMYNARVVLKRFSINIFKNEPGLFLTKEGLYEAKAEIFNKPPLFYTFQVVVDKTIVPKINCRANLPTGDVIETDILQEENGYSLVYAWEKSNDKKQKKYWFFTVADKEVLGKIAVSFHSVS